MERQRVARLGIPFYMSVFRHVRRVEGGLDVVEESAVLLRVGVLVEHGSHARHQVGGVGEHHRREDGLRHFRARSRHGRVTHRIGVQPVAVVVAALVLPEKVGIVGANELDPSLGRVVALAELPPVAVLLPETPRHDDARVAPAGNAHEVGALSLSERALERLR